MGKDNDALHQPLPLENEIEDFFVVLGPRGHQTTRKRIALLHGVLQDHSCWLDTAHALITTYPGTEVLLLDFVGHGRSVCPGGDVTYCQATVMVRQVQRVLEQVGWVDEAGRATGPRLVFGGLSLGGGIAMRWAESEARLQSVERFVLVAAAGLEQPEWLVNIFKIFVRLGGGILSMLFSPLSPGVPPISRTLQSLQGQFYCMLDGAPTYGMAQDMPNRVRAKGVPISLVISLCDEICPPRNRFWLGGTKQPLSDGVVVTKSFWPHGVMCTQLHHLKLHLYPTMWGFQPGELLQSKL